MQTAGLGAWMTLRERVAPSDGLEVEAFADELDHFGQSGSAKTEGVLNDAGLAAYVTCDVEGCGLAFSQRAHHLEAFDRRVGRLQRLEALDPPDQLLELAVVRFDDVVQVFDLSMDGLFWALTPFFNSPSAAAQVGALC